MLQYLKNVLAHVPSDWINLTTHRLDIYDESSAKVQFLTEFENLYQANNFTTDALNSLPTAFDYIRLGHPLSCVLEWAIAKNLQIEADHVISFSSKTTPILAVLRKNAFEKKNTRILYKGEIASFFDADVVRQVYNYSFELEKVDDLKSLEGFDGSTLLISQSTTLDEIVLSPAIDFLLTIQNPFGSVLLVNGEKNAHYVSEIQHVRRRETIAMTPANCLSALKQFVGDQQNSDQAADYAKNKALVQKTINEITRTHSKALVGSSGLSVQYAIMMGLIHDAIDQHPGKAIKIIVPPNCYGGTNDQARRVAASVPNVTILDLPVDGDNDMVQSIDRVLEQVATLDAVPYIIAEIPTNPRVEVPNLDQLRTVLSQERRTPSGTPAIDPVFILDQTFCPNVQFLGDDNILASIRTISYVSGSKFPSGGKCTAGYCVANTKAEKLLDRIEQHLQLCDNAATDLQMELLAQQLPSMNDRIYAAYQNTRAFVNFIASTLPSAKINFVSEELAQQGFTPSVFSLDLPTKGATHEEREAHKRELNLQLINKMITEIPNESKFCVSYGQLKGCYWTIPATSTQGTTKESDKDYIVRVALSGNMDLEHHKQVFLDFAKTL